MQGYVELEHPVGLDYRREGRTQIAKNLVSQNQYRLDTASGYSLPVRAFSFVRIKLSKAKTAMGGGNTRMVNRHCQLIASSST